MMTRKGTTWAAICVNRVVVGRLRELLGLLQDLRVGLRQAALGLE